MRLVEKLRSYMVKDVKQGSYAQNDVDLFCLWRASDFCYGFVDFWNKLFIETVDSVTCFLCQYVTCLRCMQSSDLDEDIFAT